MHQQAPKLINFSIRIRRKSRRNNLLPTLDWPYFKWIIGRFTAFSSTLTCFFGRKMTIKRLYRFDTSPFRVNEIKYGLMALFSAWMDCFRPIPCGLTVTHTQFGGAIVLGAWQWRRLNVCLFATEVRYSACKWCFCLADERICYSVWNKACIIISLERRHMILGKMDQNEGS